jgi:hypothetical protein
MGRRSPRLEVFRPVLGRVDGRAEGERALDRVAGSLVVDVVQDQSIEVEVVQPFDGGARDLREPLGGRRLPRRGDREEDEVTLTGSDARGDLHLAKVAGFDSSPLICPGRLCTHPLLPR